MRVVAGEARSIPLFTPKGNNTRPTSDRIKETLFNIIRDEVFDCNFLDLFSGSGAIRIEAISRGAAKAIFVENDREALNCIRMNIQKTKFENRSKIIAKDVIHALKGLVNEKFHIIFMDPPYNKGLEENVLQSINFYNLLEDNGTLIMETALDADIDYLSDLHYDRYKLKKYKTSQHIFLKRK